MRKVIAIIFCLMFCLCSVNNSYAEEWYKKGDLHKSTIVEWKQASYNNRLATSGDFFVSITKSHNPKLQRKMDNIRGKEKYLEKLKLYAVELEACISELVSGKNWRNLFSPDTKIAKVAAMCYSRLYGLK